MNFGAATMIDGIKRIVNNFPDGTPPATPPPGTTVSDENGAIL